MNIDVTFTWNGQTGQYEPPADRQDVVDAARYVVCFGSTALIRVAGSNGNVIARVIPPPTPSPLYILDPTRMWKRAVIKWITGKEPGKHEPLRLRCWTLQSDKRCWKKSVL